MLNTDQDGEKGADAPSPAAMPDAGSPDAFGPDASGPDTPAPPGDETVLEAIGAVIDDAKLYAAAEIAFQKTRAGLLGRNLAVAAGAIVIALILLHIAIIALAVGLVIALEPLVSIWGAIAIVVGVMLLGVGWLGWVAFAKGRVIGEMFAADPSTGDPQAGREEPGDKPA